MRRFLVYVLLLWSPVAFAQLFFVEDNTGQFYSVNTSTGAATLVATIAGITSNTIGATESPNPNVLFASSYQDLVSFNVNGTGATTLGTITGAGIGQNGAEGLTYCINANVLYGIINTNFFTINPATGARIVALASTTADVEGLACDHSANIVYGLASAAGAALYRYVPGTNTWSLVGSTGLDTSGVGLAFDPAAGVLYAVDGNSGNIYRINPATAVATLVGSMGIGAVGGGLAFIPGAAPVVASGIPALSEWVLAGLVVALGTLGIFAIRRRRNGGSAFPD